MNLVGKILTVLICVMSIVFAWTAVMVYATHRNWYDVVMRTPQDTPAGQKPGLKFQLQDEKTQREQLETQLARLTKELQEEKDARDAQVGELTTAVDGLQREQKDRAAELNSRAQELDRALAANRVQQTNMNELEAERKRLAEATVKSQQERDAAFQASLDAAVQVHQVRTEQARLEGRLAELTVDANRMRDVIRSSGGNPDADPAGMIPDVKGDVLAAAGGGLLEISIGADDGLIKGHRLEVFRMAAGKSSYLGRVEVVRTEPDRAVCKVLPAYRKGEIREGDSVASRLN